MAVLVLTIDQRASRTGPDRVPEALAALAGVPALGGFERTAGDEVQGVLDDPATLPRAVEVLLRAQAWSIGIGVGEVSLPLPDHARAGTGAAYLHAREAVTAAKSSPWHLRVAGEPPAARQLESALWLWAAVLARRTTRGWEVADLVDEGLTYEQVGRRLGISQSAVSQRAQAAGIVEGRRARELVTHLAVGALGQDGTR
ncbi:sigma factor-like helix-turn-helix DNA-binding protein [Nocardioides dongkuii]|uniref:sigma factor-like helix-turn-helix DNA-binding protein n=1 Tax=Nocardioides dongkuii TaxID=2760089 RepID=UPI0015FD4000|nr:sigma factor-like helix-turn-helix DNA-binding protein [Nocardioides dongkuii]